MFELGNLKNPFILILFIILSWLLIHVFAVFGIFLAFAFPIWWLLSPKTTTCIFCRVGKEGTICPVCKTLRRKEDGLHPKTILSMFVNAFLVLLCSIASFGIVMGEKYVLETYILKQNTTTVTFSIPDKGQYKIEEVFPMNIGVNDIKEAINVIQADITFDPEKLELVDISTKDSIMKVFIQKEINNTAGYARLTGGLNNPGYTGDSGHFATAYFKAKSAGLAEVEFLPSSMVLKNDGKGTNMLKSFSSASYVILGEYLSEEEQVLQEEYLENEIVDTEALLNQLIVYEENPNVLGVSTEEYRKDDGKIIPETKDTTVSEDNVVLNILQKIDTFIVNIYTNIFN